MVVDIYEPQYLALIVFGGFVALSFVVYAFSALGIQEKSYEQAVAEQRARLEKEQLQQREVKRQKRKPFFDKKKREREKHESSPGILRQEVEQAVDPYIEDTLPPTPPPVVKEEKVKAEKVKPSPKKPKQPKQPKQVVEETIPEARPAPVQEAAPPPKQSHTTKTRAPKIVEEQVQKREAPVVAAAAPPPQHEQPSPAKAKKSKATSGDGDTPALRGKSLISAVKSAPLKDAEIQQLIEILLNRQGGSASADDWVKANQRNDPVSALKKQLQEKEQALHNEMLLAQSASQKVKELRQHSISLETQYRIKNETQTREIEAFHIRFQQTHESHTRENQALQSRIKQLQQLLDESNPEMVKQLREENNRLKSEAGHATQQKEQLMGAELARLQAELQKKSSDMSANEAQLRSLEAQINQYKQQRTHLGAEQRENETALSKRLAEVSEELRKAETKNQSLTQQVDSSSSEAEKVKGQLAELNRIEGDRTNTLQIIQAKLKESESQCQSLQDKVSAVESRLAEREQEQTKADQELEALRKEKDSLQIMLQTREKRSEAEGQEAPPPANGEVADHTDSAPKEDSILLKEHNNIVADKTKTIEGLEQQLDSGRTELTRLQADIEQQKQRNNSLREKNRKLMEVVSAAEKSSSENAKQAVQAVKEETSKSVADEQASAKGVLQRLFPAVNLDSSLAHKDWLSQFEGQAAQVLSSQSSSDSQAEEYVLKINTLEAEKDQLSSQCQHYQTVLSDTEGMVKELQDGVEKEEERVKGRILDLEQEKEQLSAKCKELQGKVSDLETAADSTRSQEDFERLRVEKEQLSSECKQLQEKVDDLEAAGSTRSQESTESIDRLAEEKEELVSRNQELERRLETVEERLSSSVREAEKEKAQLAAQCQNYQVVLRETEGILNKLQSSVETEEVKWEEKLKHTESSLGQAKAEVVSLQGEISALSSKEDEKTDENSRLESDLSEAQSTIEKLRQDQEAAVTNYDATSQELQEVKVQLHQLKEELEAANQRAEHSSDMVEENAETKTKLSTAEAAVKRLEGELQQAKTESGSRVEGLQKELASSRSQLEQAQKEVGSLKEQLAAGAGAGAAAGAGPGQEELEKAQAALKEAQEKAAAKEKELADVQESLKKEKGLTQDLGKAAAKLQTMLKKTQVALNAEKATVAKLQMTNGAKEGQAQGSTSLTESQVELQLADAANEETKQADGTGV